MDTASEAISFHSRLQKQAANFYEEMSHRFTEDKKTFLTIAKEHTRHQKDVQQAYNYVISDALEACFAFQGMNKNNYQLDLRIDGDMSYTNALKIAIAIEETIANFCNDGAERSKGLLHDVPEALDLVAKRCRRHKQTLKSLLDQESSK